MILNQGCCCTQRKQFAAAFTHNTFKWDVVNGIFDNLQSFKRCRVTHSNLLGGMSSQCITDFVFVGIHNRVFMARRFIPNKTSFDADWATIVAGFPYPGTGVGGFFFEPNKWTEANGTDVVGPLYDIVAEGVMPCDDNELDIDLFNMLLAEVDWDAIPDGYTKVYNAIDLSNSLTEVSALTAANIFAVIDLAYPPSTTSTFVTSATDGPVSAFFVTCPADYILGGGVTIVRTAPIDIYSLTTRWRYVLGTAGSPPRYWGRYEGILSANKITGVHNELLFDLSPPLDAVFDTTDCAIPRSYQPLDCFSDVPAGIVSPPPKPGFVFIPFNSQDYPCP